MNKEQFIEIIQNQFEIDGPAYRGGEMPPVRSLAMNESKYNDGLRFKDWSWYESKSKLIMNYEAQETTTGYEEFIKEFTRVINNYKILFDYNKVINVKFRFNVRGENVDTIVEKYI